MLHRRISGCKPLVWEGSENRTRMRSVTSACQSHNEASAISPFEGAGTDVIWCKHHLVRDRYCKAPTDTKTRPDRDYAVMPPKESRNIDGILRIPAFSPGIVEVDESQHFNWHRGTTLRLYLAGLSLAFDRKIWLEHSQDEPRAEIRRVGKTQTTAFSRPRRSPPTERWNRQSAVQVFVGSWP